MFPLTVRKTLKYVFGSPTWYSNFHLGVDYDANYVPLFAPFNGEVVKIIPKAFAPDGGNTMWFKPDHDNVVMRFLHLDKFLVGVGRVKEGQQIAITGNTGASTYRHLHLDISKNAVNINNTVNFLDPEKYNWNSTPPPLQKTFMKVTVIANKINWTTLPHKLATLSDWFKADSSNRLEIVFDVRNTSFDNIPLQHFQGYKSIDIDWYRKNITPLATGQATVFLMNPEDYNNGNTFGYMTYGDTRQPVRMEVAALENGDNDAFLVRTFHEICHALFFLTGQPDYVNGDYLVHQYLYQNPPKSKELLSLIDYRALQNKLVTIKPQSMSQAKVVKSKTSNTVYICYPVPTMTHLTERASLEGIAVPNAIPNSDAL